MKKPTPSPFEAAFAQHAVAQAERLRKRKLVTFTRAIINLRKQTVDESGIRDISSQNLLGTGTFNP